MLVQPSGVGSRPAEGVRESRAGTGRQRGGRRGFPRRGRGPGQQRSQASQSGPPGSDLFPAAPGPVLCWTRARAAASLPAPKPHPPCTVTPWASRALRLATVPLPSRHEALGRGPERTPGEAGRPGEQSPLARPAARGYWCLHGVRREWGETLASRGRGGRGFRHAAPPDARGAVNVTAGSRPPAGSPGSVVRLLRAAPVQTHSRYLERFLHQTRNNRWQQLTADPIRKWTSLSLEA